MAYGGKDGAWYMVENMYTTKAFSRHKTFPGYPAWREPLLYPVWPLKGPVLTTSHKKK